MKILWSISLIILLFSCGSEEVPEKKDPNWTKDLSTDLNKELAEREKIDIKLFLDRHPDWSMKESGSGLYFYKYEDGKGLEARSGKVAQVQFDIQLLDGTKCYNTAEDEVEEFIIDHSHVETGVQEAIKLMREGDKAKMIIPSHLAHGLTGDFNKIPPLTALVIDLHLYKIVR
jgi:FKBP-type peptidyl-prolyl cis-trans isomerase FkpA